MMQLDQQIARRLTRFYVLALTCIAVLSLSGLLFMRQTINDHDDDSRIVNVAGRQRMLSQRLTKLAMLRVMEIPTEDTASFTTLLTTWSQSHIQLKNGNLQMEKAYVVRKSGEVDRMFTEIEPVFQSIYNSLALINTASATLEQKKTALQRILKSEPSFLKQMDAIVFQFDKESFERVKFLEQIEWILTIATLLMLLIDALLIFRPVVTHTKNVIKKLTESDEALRLVNENLAAANRELEETNRQLADTQRELLRATEEKYRLQIAEDTMRSAGLLEGQEEERRRFARELHDGIGQMLTGLKLHAEKLKVIPFPEPKHRQRFDEMCALIYDVIQTTRQTSHNLMPSVLDDFGLGPALQFLAEQTAHASGINVLFEGGSDEKRLNPAQEIGLYRIAQEALNNAVKHAEAKKIRIKWQHHNAQTILTVEDDGKGFLLKTAPKKGRPIQPTNGLNNMHTRTRLLNGELIIASKQKKGTVISVHLPDNIH